MRVWLCLLALVLAGCGQDARLPGLRKAMTQAKAVLADPRLAELARKRAEKTPEERLLEAFFSPEGRALLPKRQDSEIDYSPGPPDRAPGRIVYLRDADLPWAVVLQPDPASHRILLAGFGKLTNEPVMGDSFRVEPGL